MFTRLVPAPQITDTVYETLREAICDGVLAPDTRLIQDELAERLGVSRQTVNAIETGKYDPSLPLAFNIARVFGMRIEEIFSPNGEGR